ncbi:hypothetical protein [Streptomyces sp. NPDC006739]|uniref:hypothetical protein n=1 Tax=Streptomyces sp. NPDC006739 TaxID=3364763 RepID=UPI003686E39E
MVWLNLLWGMCGALAMDGLDIAKAVRQDHCFPWRDRETKEPLWRTEYIVMVLINAAVGGLVASAMGLTDPHGISPWVAVGLGAGGMATLQKATAQIPLTEPPAAGRVEPSHLQETWEEPVRALRSGTPPPQNTSGDAEHEGTSSGIPGTDAASPTPPRLHQPQPEGGVE